MLATEPGILITLLFIGSKEIDHLDNSNFSAVLWNRMGLFASVTSGKETAMEMEEASQIKRLINSYQIEGVVLT